MKKLMMIAAGVMLAGSSFGYSYHWKVGSDAITDGGSAVKGATVYLFNATDFSQESFVNALKDGTSFASIVESYAMDVTVATGTDGIASTFSATAEDWGTPSSTGSSTKFKAYFAVANEAADKIFIAKSATITRDESGSSAVTDIDFEGKYFDYLGNNFKPEDGWSGNSSSGWYSTVPEPTSGLLLLLGVAGLALRRRRA